MVVPAIVECSVSIPLSKARGKSILRAYEVERGAYVCPPDKIGEEQPKSANFTTPFDKSRLAGLISR